MRITESQLRRIIRAEARRVLFESNDDVAVAAAAKRIRLSPPEAMDEDELKRLSRVKGVIQRWRDRGSMGMPVPHEVLGFFRGNQPSDAQIDDLLTVATAASKMSSGSFF